MSKHQQAYDDWIARGESDDYPTHFEKEPLKCRNCGATCYWQKVAGKWQLQDFGLGKHVCLTSTVKFWKLPKKFKNSLLKSSS